GVLELYPSKRVVVRFDGGDTAIRHPARFGQISFSDPVQLLRPAKFKHNFQFTAGVAFRLGDFPNEASNVSTASDTQERTKRFEVGVQFTSLFVNRANAPGSLTLPRTHNEPGFGGRFTFNLTENIAFEAEGNYFTREQSPFFQEGGKMFQGQFGGKVGKRFENWGVFGKSPAGVYRIHTSLRISVWYSDPGQFSFRKEVPPIPRSRRSRRVLYVTSLDGPLRRRRHHNPLRRYQFPQRAVHNPQRDATRPSSLFRTRLPFLGPEFTRMSKVRDSP
ncbi:MAG TPA: hypothetical protein VFP47_15385, partial [Pyrinomonadaceae bacterium]|nr:hypothetical protein [Pyrinomonadaceae bacterium]